MNIRQLVLDKNYEELKKYFDESPKLQGEVHVNDDRNHFTTLTMPTDVSIEYFERATVENPETMLKVTLYLLPDGTVESV